MDSTTPTAASAGLLGLGGVDVRSAFGPGLCSGGKCLAAPVSAPIAAVQGSGLPAAGTAVRIRPVTRQAVGHGVVTTTSFENNGTTLGNLSPGRPQS